MKNIFLKSIYFLVITLFISISSTAQKSNQKAIIKTTLNCDHCKQCETCGLKFNTEMLKIKGIKMYELDEKMMTFTVYYNAKKTTLHDIKEGISKLGYDADEVKADVIAYEKLDSCCKL